MQTEPVLTRRQRIEAAMIAAVASPIIAALGATLRWKVEGTEHLDAVIGCGRQPIITIWHGRILPGLCYFRDRNIVVITSQNFDGEWIARILHRFGFGTARGSTSRGGVRALVQLRQDLRDGRGVAFTLDGPRGPARVAQPGAAWLAGATGYPLLPLHFEASRFWTMGSWDRTQIPKPFATVALTIGEPVAVQDTAEGSVDAARLALENSLRRLEERARDLAHSSL
jgi:lysophospholipid acyltransferase (LPLAT)-like uncharacterized protein